jgi:uncharacterized membrane protein YsdA (DUF1294 family)
VDQILLIILLGVNFISLIFFGLDKLWAMRGGRRISESRLLTLGVLGPFGAELGMLMFRHKTRKTKFLLVPIFLLFQLVLLFYARAL